MNENHLPVNPEVNFPCGVCYKNINKNHRYLQCAICKFNFHIKCNKIDCNAYIKMRNVQDNIHLH